MTEYTCSHCTNTVPVNTTTHLRTCPAYRDFIARTEATLTREHLEAEYVTAGKSATHIAAGLGLANKRLVVKKLQEYGFEIRSTAAEFANQSHRQALTRQKSLEKYGVEHHLKNPAVVAARTRTVQERYGVDNVFQADTIKAASRETCLSKYGVEHATQAPEIAEKVKATNLERYGVDNPWKSDEVKKKIVATRAQKNNLVRFVSKVSQRFCWDLYRRLPSEIQADCYFSELNQEFGKSQDGVYYFYDFTIPSLRYCVEFNGTYYHADPRVYEPTYVNQKRKMTAEQIWDFDRRKHAVLETQGFHVEVVWQSEDHHTALDRVLAQITAWQTRSGE